MNHRHIVPIIAGLLTLIACDPLAAQGRRDTVVTKGDSAVGDGTFSTFGTLYLNDSGDVSWEANLAGTSGGTANDNGVYVRPAGGGITEITREGRPAPGGGNGNVSSLINIGLADDRNCLIHAFYSGTSGGTSDDSAITLWRNFSNVVVAREGNATSDINGMYGSLSAVINSYGLNDFGNVAFRNLTVGSSAGSADDDAIFSGLALVTREGLPAPGGIGNFTSFSNFARVNHSGQTGFAANVGSINGVYRSGSSGIVPVYIEGDAAPDGNGTFSFLTGSFTLNDQGQMAFEGVMTGTSGGSQDSEAILRSNGSSVVQIARESNTVPGGNGDFNTFFSNSVRQNESGQVVFTCGLRNTSGGSADHSGIYRSNTSGFTLTEIAREGTAIDTGNGLLGGIDFAPVALNDSGHVAFSSSITGTIDNSGIFIGDGEELITVVQEGQAVATSTVNTLEFTGGERFQSGLNNKGQVVYEATLDDGSAVVQTWTPDLHWRRTFSSDWDVSSYWTLGIAPDAIYDVYIDPSGALEVEGPSSDTTVRSLTIGGGTGIATFEMENGAVLTATNDVLIEPTGVLTGNGTIDAEIDNQGTILASDVVVTNLVENNGLIEGNGRIAAATIDNATSGTIRVEENVDLVIQGNSLTNVGLIDVVDGTLEVNAFANNVDGRSLIFASNAFLRFNGGLQNGGGIGITTGTTYVYGDVNNVAGGVINVSGGANATFVDDLTQNGTLQVVSVGNTYSAAIFFGEFGGTGGFIGGGDVFALGDLRPGNSPASVTMGGNLYLGAQTNTEIEIGGINTGEFDQLLVSGDLSLSGSIDVVLINGFIPVPGDEWVIADVAGNVVGEFIGVPQGSQVGTSGLYIYYDGGDGNDIVLSTNPPTVELTPDSFLVTKGTYSSGDVTDLATSDNSDVSIRRRTSDIQSRTEFEVKTISPTLIPSTMTVTLEGAVFARSTVVQTISLFDYNRGTWEVVDSRNANRFNDRVDTVEITGDLSRFVELGTNCMKARVLYKSNVARQLFTSNTDQFQWTIGL